MPLSIREISSRSSTSRSSRSTRSRIASPTSSRSSRLAAVFSPVSGVRRSWATSATNRRSRSIRSRIASAIRSIASPSFATSSWPLAWIRASSSPAVTRSAIDAARRSRSESRPASSSPTSAPPSRSRRGHLDHGLAQVAELLPLRRVGVAHVDLVAPVRRAPARPHGRLAVPGAAVGRQLAPAHRSAQGRRHGRVAGRQRRAREATAGSAGRSAPPTAPGPPRSRGRGRGGPRRSPRRPRRRPPPPRSRPAARMRAPAAIAASSSLDHLVARPANGLDHVRRRPSPAGGGRACPRAACRRPRRSPTPPRAGARGFGPCRGAPPARAAACTRWGEADGLTRHAHLHAGAVDLELPDAQNRGRVVAGDPAQHGPQPCRQDRRLERLRDVVIRARLEAEHDVDGSVRAVSITIGTTLCSRIVRHTLTPSTPGSITSRRTRSGGCAPKRARGRRRRRRRRDRKAVALERQLGHLADRRVVLDEQDARPCAALAGAGRAPVSGTLHDHSVQGKSPAHSPKHAVVTRPIGDIHELSHADGMKEARPARPSIDLPISVVRDPTLATSSKVGKP